MVVESFYLHSRISYTGKMIPLYWISPLVPSMGCISISITEYQTFYRTIVVCVCLLFLCSAYLMFMCRWCVAEGPSDIRCHDLSWDLARSGSQRVLLSIFFKHAVLGLQGLAISFDKIPYQIACRDGWVLVIPVVIVPYNRDDIRTLWSLLKQRDHSLYCVLYWPLLDVLFWGHTNMHL